MPTSSENFSAVVESKPLLDGCCLRLKPTSTEKFSVEVESKPLPSDGC